VGGNLVVLYKRRLPCLHRILILMANLFCRISRDVLYLIKQSLKNSQESLQN